MTATWLRRCEWILFVLLSGIAIALHLRFVTHVGGLWRDETNSVNVATLSSLVEAAHHLDFDSFPILFFAVMRGWVAVFGINNDTAIRALGCITGVGILAALWLNARSFGSGLPVLSFALLGLNVMIIRYGDSTRAYGLGILLILLTIRSFWRLVDESASLKAIRVAEAAILALLSVQCLYYNCVLLLAIACGAIAVAALRRAWRSVFVVLSIGAIAALSMLPYVPMMRRMRGWTFLVSYPADFAWLWTRLCEVTGSPDPFAIWLWVGLFFAGISIGVQHLRRFFQDTSAGLPRRVAAVVFASVTLVLGVIGYACFLNVLNYYTQPWYYVTIVAFAGCLIDLLFGVASHENVYTMLSTSLRGSRLVVAVGLLALATLPAWAQLTTRHTNADLLAGRLQAMAEKGDVVLVPHFECAIPLCRYYQGPAEVITLPPIDDHRFHRYDLVVQEMMKEDATAPVLVKLEQILRAGHRVFIAGEMPFPDASRTPPKTRPLTQDASGAWHGDRYYTIWQEQAGQFLRAHATAVADIGVPIPEERNVQEYEDLKLRVLSGWR